MGSILPITLGSHIGDSCQCHSSSLAYINSLTSAKKEQQRCFAQARFLLRLCALPRIGACISFRIIQWLCQTLGKLSRAVRARKKNTIEKDIPGTSKHQAQRELFYMYHPPLASVRAGHGCTRGYAGPTLEEHFLRNMVW